MISKEVLAEISELIEKAINIKMLGKGNVCVEYSGSCNAVYVCVFGESNKVTYRDVCYLDWEDGTCCKDVMFPKFNTVLDNMLEAQKEAV